MKSSLIIFLCCIITVAIAAPAPTAIDWPRISERLNSVEELVTSRVDEFGSIIRKDNPSVGLIADRALKEFLKKSGALLNELKIGAQETNLSVPNIDTYFIHVASEWVDVEKKVDKSKLSLEAAIKAAKLETETIIEFLRRLAEIRALLRAPAL